VVEVKIKVGKGELPGAPKPGSRKAGRPRGSKYDTAIESMRHIAPGEWVQVKGGTVSTGITIRGVAERRGINPRLFKFSVRSSGLFIIRRGVA
jgi:hypothetical protein